MPDNDRLLTIFKSIEARCHRRATVAGIRTAAILQFEAARALYKNPTHQNWMAFSKAEIEWASYTTARCTHFSEELFTQLRQRRPSWPMPHLNGAGNMDWNPAHGYVYGFWSIQRPRQVKIGMTTRHPSHRLDELKKRYELPHLDHLFFFEVTKPREVEHEVHKRVGSYLVADKGHHSREWFELSPEHALRTVCGTIDHLKQRHLQTKYVSRKIVEWKEVDFWPTGVQHLGGRVSSQAQEPTAAIAQATLKTAQRAGPRTFVVVKSESNRRR